MNIKPIIKSIVESFRYVKGIEAIVLVGSRATKTENEMYCLKERVSEIIKKERFQRKIY